MKLTLSAFQTLVVVLSPKTLLNYYKVVENKNHNIHLQEGQLNSFDKFPHRCMKADPKFGCNQIHI